MRDYDTVDRSLVLHHAKRGKQRIVYLTVTVSRMNGRNHHRPLLSEKQ